MPGAALSLPSFSLYCYISFNIQPADQAFPVKLCGISPPLSRKTGLLCNHEGQSSIDIKNLYVGLTHKPPCLRVICTQSRSHTTNQLPLLPLGKILGTLLSFTFSEQHFWQLLDPISNYSSWALKPDKVQSYFPSSDLWKSSYLKLLCDNDLRSHGTEPVTLTTLQGQASTVYLGDQDLNPLGDFFYSFFLVYLSSNPSMTSPGTNLDTTARGNKHKEQLFT